jgi:gamma-glutamyltranspeptidase/glutathione hydrolase
VQGLLDKAYAAGRGRAIGDAALTPAPGEPRRGGTVYLCAADGDGVMVSFIQSNFQGFGSGVVVPGTGIALQNRGRGFTLDPDHPNRVAPGKRPFHTLVPAMVLKDGAPWLSFGVMGGDMQAQGHAQVLSNLIDFGMNIQEAGEAPRFRDSGNGLALESPFSAEARAGLTSRGHHLITSTGAWGGFQGILIDPKTRVLMAGSDPRKDGMAAGW